MKKKKDDDFLPQQHKRSALCWVCLLLCVCVCMCSLTGGVEYLEGNESTARHFVFTFMQLLDRGTMCGRERAWKFAANERQGN